jgi:thiol-disulfide isomerase/thioredoxin
MTRLLTITAVLMLTATGVADEGDHRVDFALFDSVMAIGEGAADPKPGEGDTLLLQFWASWCHSCGSLMWDMDELVSQNDGVRYVAVSIDDEADDARTYIRKHRLYEKYRDRYFVDTDKLLSESLSVTTVPSILLVDNEGTVLVRKSGHLNSADLRDFVIGMRNAR